MRLRTRLALRIALWLAPLALLGAVAQSFRDLRAIELAVGDVVLRRMVVERARCEADPSSFTTAIGEGTEVRAIDRDSLDPSLREALEERVAASRRIAQDPENAGELAVRMPWDEGPCALVIMRWRGSSWQRPLSLLRTVARRTGQLLLAVGVVALLVAGAPVGRIRRLMTRVREVARGGYREPLPPEPDDEIGDLSRAFDEAAREVRAELARREARERALEEHLAATAHDLGTPLTVLSSLLVQLRDAARRGEAVNPRTVNDAIAEAHYLGGIVGNLALRARADAGLLDASRQRCDLRELVERVAIRHEALGESRQIAVERAVPEAMVPVEIDPTAVQQALSNLVQNAVQYGREGGYCAIVLERDARTFFLRVEDDGPGISEDELSRVLAPGARGEIGRRMRPEGSGLGLAIAQQVLSLYGWSLHGERREPHGLVLTVSGRLAEPA